MIIDCSISLALSDKDVRVDLEQVITGLGYIPVIMHSGVRKFTRENFTVEFVAHRKGGRDGEVVSIRKWNITASPLPFVDLLLGFPFTANFGSFQVKAPLPEAFFVHKLITAQRRPGESKRDKDLDQCSIIARQLDLRRLDEIVNSLKLSKKTLKALRTSCDVIGFPPQKLNLQQ